MKKVKYILMLLMAVVSAISVGAKGVNKGHLFIIGGGERPDSLMTQYLDLGGGKDAKVLVVPFASGDQHDTGSYQKEQFEKLGAASVDYISCEKDQIDLPENLLKLKGVTAIFFSGGDQNVLTAYLLGTKFLAGIRDIYRRGGVVGGTSAGAAVMSKIMLTGEERNVPKDDEGDFRYIKKGTVDTAEGFGFVTNAIIDQHFIIRRRENRLMSLVLQHPEYKGIGIDEATAIIVKPNGEFRVAGESQVMIFEALENPSLSSTGYFKTNGVKLQLLTAGDTSKL